MPRFAIEGRGAPGVKLNIKDIEWIWPQIYATPIQIDHWEFGYLKFKYIKAVRIKTLGKLKRSY